MEPVIFIGVAAVIVVGIVVALSRRGNGRGNRSRVASSDGGAAVYGSASHGDTNADSASDAGGHGGGSFGGDGGSSDGGGGGGDGGGGGGSD